MELAAMPPPAPIATVAVVGAGLLGRQIAAMVAASGRAVRITDAMPGVADAATGTLRTFLAPPVASGALTWDLDAVLVRITPVPNLAAALDGADLMIEAVREEIGTKRAVFAEASRLAPEIYLATNSSSLPSSALADVVSRPDLLVNTHFFSEFWVRRMVELMGCGQTSDETLTTLATFCRSLGLFCAVVRGESKGFIINRVWRAVKREALRVVDEGHATPDEVDRLFAMFWNTDRGPFAAMDAIGLDVIADIEDSYIAVATDPTERRSPTLHRLVDAGALGLKAGRGFYAYPDPPFAAPSWPHDPLTDDEIATGG